MDITERNRITHDLGVSLQKLEKAIMGIIQAISKIIDIREPYTAGHQNKMAEVARAIALKMGFAHDICKVAIPSEILSKPGKLNEIDYLMIRTHPQAGYEILKDVEFPWDLSHMVLQHHERLDGSGYPNRLRGDEIIFEAKILAVADSIEAMATHRPYRPALGNEVALQQLSDLAGIEYDPEVVKTCIICSRRTASCSTDQPPITEPAFPQSHPYMHNICFIDISCSSAIIENFRPP